MQHALTLKQVHTAVTTFPSHQDVPKIVVGRILDVSESIDAQTFQRDPHCCLMYAACNLN
jgi:hypothetical protein